MPFIPREMPVTITEPTQMHLYHIEGKNFQRMDAEDRWTVAARDAGCARNVLTFGSDSVTTDDRITRVVFLGSAVLSAPVLEETKYQNCGGWIL